MRRIRRNPKPSPERGARKEKTAAKSAIVEGRKSDRIDISPVEKRATRSSKIIRPMPVSAHSMTWVRGRKDVPITNRTVAISKANNAYRNTCALLVFPSYSSDINLLTETLPSRSTCKTIRQNSFANTIERRFHDRRGICLASGSMMANNVDKPQPSDV